MSSLAPSMLIALRTAVASLTPSTFTNPATGVVGFGPNAPTVFRDVGYLREFENGGAQCRDFVVTLNPGEAHSTTLISGYTGNGDFILKAFVVMRHFVDGMSDSDFHCVVADDHRVVADGVTRWMMDPATAPTGIAMCELEGGVSVSADTKSGVVDSIFQFRIDYRDSLL